MNRPTYILKIWSIRRRAAVTLEYAICLPLLFLFCWGLIEFGRMTMVADTIISASQEGCRAGIIPGSTSPTVIAETNSVLNSAYISGATVTVTPTDITTLKTGETLSVSVRVPFSNVSWLPSPQFLNGRVLKASCTMLREGK